MSDLNDFPTDHIMVIRIPAIADLGVVHQGDHLIIIPGRGVVAVDTRRDPAEAVWRAAPVMPPADAIKTEPASVSQKLTTITLDRVRAVFQEHGPSTTLQVGDALRIDRQNRPSRDRVKRVVRILRDKGVIINDGKPRRNHTRYKMAADAQSKPHDAGPLKKETAEA
jgi:hypothetical protein